MSGSINVVDRLNLLLQMTDLSMDKNKLKLQWRLNYLRELNCNVDLGDLAVRYI